MDCMGDLKLRPLGALAPEQGKEWSGVHLDVLHVMPQELRVKVIDYLRRCPIFLAWMEYTRDVIADRFGVSGGAAIASDGFYYWRLDALEYIREYGISIPEEAIRHMESRSWVPPKFSRQEYLKIFNELMEIVGSPCED